jgi:hypothetical protein
MTSRDVVRAVRLVEEHMEELERAWEEIHG